MKIILLFTFFSYTIQIRGNPTPYKQSVADVKEITATTSYFDPRQEEQVIMKRNQRNKYVDDISEFIQKMNANLGMVKEKLDNRVEEMNDIIDRNLSNKEKYQMTVSNLNFKI